jgi:hypothetical protein
MEKRTTTFVVFTWAHWLIYLGVSLAIAGLTVRFIHYPTPEYTTAEKLPAILVPLAWGFAGAMLYYYRARWLKRFIWTTGQGVQVWGEQAARDWLAVREIKVEMAFTDVIAWWTAYYIRAGHSDARKTIAAYFDGSNLEVAFVEEGVGDLRHGIRKKAGLAYPGRLVVQLAPSDTAFGGKFFGTLNHEISHGCLLAMGSASDNDQQHQFMKQAGCPYA